jgi:ATP-binding cassette, subfamily B, bacterial CvaB/MchF/RaxB
MSTSAVNAAQTPQTQNPSVDLLNFSAGRRLPVIMQTEAAECGLTCLAMIAGYYGFDTDLTSLRHKYAISAHGATLKQVMDIGAKLNLSGRALKLDMQHLAQLQTPCILHWEMKHFVVLKKVSKYKVIIHDPAIGERSFSFEEVRKLFTGVALELTPTPAFEKGEDKQQLTLRQFWSRIFGLKRSLVMVLVLSLLLQLFALISPYYMQTVVDDVLLRSDDNLLLVLAIGFGLLLLIETATGFFRQMLILNFSTRLNIQMSANVFHHLIRLPMDYFAKRHMGDVVSRFGSLQQIREMLTTGMVAALIDGLMALITLVVMFVYSTTLSFIVLGVVFLYGLLRYLLYRPLRLLNEEQIMASAKEQSHFMESVRAIQTVKMFGKEADRQNQWQNRLAETMNRGIQISRWGIGFETANKLLFGLENILILFFAATAVMDNLMTVGMLYAFISYKNRFVGAMDSLIAKWVELRMLELHFNRLADMVFTPTDNLLEQGSQSSAQSASQPIQGKISVKDLSFAYSRAEAPVFSNLDFTVQPGETVAIVGASGGGKTTLLKCMMGLLSPSNGQVLADDKPLAQVAGYRSQIAAVMQEDQLLSGTIADNIACFDPKPDLEKVVVCAHLSCIHEDILQKPMQYNTLVGDMGASLSSGQKQRILLARALYHKPKILFMDEATSHLDTSNEAKINEHIRQLNITRIIVAHRPQTIRSAQRVLALKDGRLMEIAD